MANKNTIEPRAIEDTVECIEALAEIVKKNDLGKLKINTETYEIVIEGRPCPPPMPAPAGMRFSTWMRTPLLTSKVSMSRRTRTGCGSRAECSGAGRSCG